MLRALMVDVDGVLLVHPHPGGWSGELQRDLGLSPDRLQREFFAVHWADVIHGRAALHDRLQPVLDRIAPHLSSRALARYWFENDAHVDAILLDDLALVRAGGVEVHLATVQEHERAAYLWDELGWCDRFDGLHYAAALGCAKPADAFYAAVEQQTGFGPDELLLIDDREENVAGARRRGWQARLWTGRERLVTLLA